MAVGQSTSFAGAVIPEQPVFLRILDDPAFLGGVFQEIENNLRELSFAPLFEQWFELLAGLHIQYFQTETDPAGEPWPELEESTKAQKRTDPYAIGGEVSKLLETGRLFQALAFQSDDNLSEINETGSGHSQMSYGLQLSFAQEYPGILAEGYTVPSTGEFKKWEFVGVNEDVADTFAEDCAQWMIEAMKG